MRNKQMGLPLTEVGGATRDMNFHRVLPNYNVALQHPRGGVDHVVVCPLSAAQDRSQVVLRRGVATSPPSVLAVASGSWLQASRQPLKLYSKALTQLLRLLRSLSGVHAVAKRLRDREASKAAITTLAAVIQQRNSMWALSLNGLWLGRSGFRSLPVLPLSGRLSRSLGSVALHPLVTSAINVHIRCPCRLPNSRGVAVLPAL